MIAIKPGVDVKGVSTEVILGVVILSEVFWRHGIPTVMTSCRDGKHKDKSLHYIGDAVDIRLPSRFNTTAGIDLKLLAEGREALGEQYDLILESDHLHLEFDPKVDERA
jgi:hypothetical protein